MEAYGESNSYGDDCRQCIHSSTEQPSYIEMSEDLMYCKKFARLMNWKYGRCAEFNHNRIAEFAEKYRLK